MVTMEFVVFALGAILSTISYGTTTQCLRYCSQQAREGRGTLVQMTILIWTIFGGYSSVRELSCLDMDPIRGLFALARSYKINFDTKDIAVWMVYNFKNIIVSQVPPTECVIRESTFPRRRYMSDTETSMPLMECHQTFQNWRCVVSRMEAPIYTAFPVLPIRATL